MPDNVKAGAVAGWGSIDHEGWSWIAMPPGFA